MAAELVGISLSVEPGRAAYIPVGHVYAGAPEQLSREQVLNKLKPWLQSAKHAKLGQHFKYDMHVFANYGIERRRCCARHAAGVLCPRKPSTP